MPIWSLSPLYKKNAVERMFFRNELGQTIIITEGFRGATFTTESDARPLSDIELKNNNDEGYLLDEDWELEEMWDGSWSDIEAGELDQGDISDEDIDKFTDAWYEDGFEGVEALGWTQDDCEYIFYGPLELTNNDTGQVWKGEATGEEL